MDKLPQMHAAPGDRFALIIGINTYRDPTIVPLRFARNDAVAMQEFLTDPRFGKFKPENVHLLLDEEATAGDIRSQVIYWLGAQVSERDEVWIFFAGKGATAATHSRLQYLATCDTMQNDLAGTAIASTEIDEWLQVLVAQRILIFLDCGFNADGEGRTLALHDTAATYDENFLAPLAHDHRRHLIAAAIPNQICREDEQVEHGLFSYLLLRKLLSELVTNEHPALTFDDLYQHLAIETPRRSESFGGVQNPLRLGGNGDFALLTPSLTAATGTPAITETALEQVEVLLLLAQQEARADRLEKARDLLHGVLQIDPENQKAQRGLKIVQNESERIEREQKIKEAFTRARRFVDERNPRAALETYRHILQLDPGSKSAVLGVESCEALLGKDQPAEASPAEPAPVEPAKPARHTKPYDRYIWPYIGWWILLWCCWKAFAHLVDPDSSTSFMQHVFVDAFWGAIIGLAHGSLNYAVIKTVKIIRRRRLLHKV